MKKKRNKEERTQTLDDLLVGKRSACGEHDFTGKRSAGTGAGENGGIGLKEYRDSLNPLQANFEVR